MRLRNNNYKFAVLFLILFSLQSEAYLGPGMSTGVLATIIGIFTSILLLVFSIVYYPIKRALKRRKELKR